MADQKTDNTPRSRMELHSPKALIDKLIDYIAPGSGWVLITDCEQYGDALLDVIRAHPNTEFTLTTSYFEVPNDLLRKLADAHVPIENVTLIVTDSYEDFLEETYDRIISIPDFGRALLARDVEFICRDPSLATLQNLIGSLNEGGELAIVLPAKITFGSGSVAQLREFIESQYSIREIDILPEGLFLPYTAIRTYLFVFSTGKTDEVLLRKYEPDRPIDRKTPCEALILDKEITLEKDEFEKLSGWIADPAFSEDTEEMKAYNASPVPKEMIKDVATVFRGKAVNTKTEDGRIGVINLSDITDTGIDYSHVDRMDAEDRKIEKYLLEEGDVLVSSRGTTMKVAVVEELPMKSIPSVNFIVIRPGERIRGAYLKLFLESPVGVQMLERLQRGGNVMNINYKDVEALEVPVPWLDYQDARIEDYNRGLKEYVLTVSMAEKKWDKTRQEVQSKLF